MTKTEARKVLQDVHEKDLMLRKAIENGDDEEVWFIKNTLEVAQPMIDEANKTLLRK